MAMTLKNKLKGYGFCGLLVSCGLLMGDLPGAQVTYASIGQITVTSTTSQVTTNVSGRTIPTALSGWFLENQSSSVSVYVYGWDNVAQQCKTWDGYWIMVPGDKFSVGNARISDICLQASTSSGATVGYSRN
jgi:hypothetical protein